MTRLRRIFLRECQAKIRRIVGYVTNFCLVLSEEKASKMSGYFFKDPNSHVCTFGNTIHKSPMKNIVYQFSNLQILTIRAQYPCA